MVERSLEMVVASIAQATEDIRVIELRAADGGDLPAFTAGAHLDLTLANGLVRSYSLMNDPAERHRYVLGIARDRNSRGGSTHIHDVLRTGDRMQAGPLRNNFALDENAPATVLIAGGIGATPMMSMAARLEALGARWRLYQAARSRRHAPFLEDIRRFEGRTSLHLDDEHLGQPMNLGAIVAAAEEGAHFYCCGPAPMLAAFQASTAHLPANRVHVEHFASSVPIATAGGFDVELARSGKRVTVAAGQTILDAVAEVGVAVPFSCLAGVCGSCETRVIEGVPDHRDLILTEAERATNRSMMICCSGSLSERLVLDL